MCLLTSVSPNRNLRLELVWVNKHVRPRLEPRLLVEHPDRSSPAGTDAGNRLIFGDNLLALKALEPEFAGRVKCCFIDPPYNTGSAFEQYDDGLEHSIWLGLMRDRLEIIRRLLSVDGSLWISIDDNEAHYLKVLCDEVFGRRNFVANVVWQKRTSPDARLRLGGAHDHILVFARDASRVSLNLLALSQSQAKSYRNPDKDPRGPWTSTDFTAQGWRPNQMYRIVSPAGVAFEPPSGRCWANVEPAFRSLMADNRIWFGPDGTARPRVKTFRSEREGVSAWSWWDNSEVGHNQEAKKESIALFGADRAFSTPKPERLLKRVPRHRHQSRRPRARQLRRVGHDRSPSRTKMGRRWIMVELGEHCHSHIMPRLAKVIDGKDGGGITETVAWKGGGGFRYFSIAPSLLQNDSHGRGIFNTKIDAAGLVAAICRIEGFVYAPSDEVYWQHGRSTETDYIYVAARFMPPEELNSPERRGGRRAQPAGVVPGFSRKPCLLPEPHRPQDSQPFRQTVRLGQG